MSDKANNTYIIDGYKGIEYAIARKADIIVCAWSGGKITEAEKTIVEKAKNQGITIIASAGNMNSKIIAPPASYPGVIAISAMDTLLRKRSAANYHPTIDLCAPGQLVPGPHPKGNNTWFYEGETSAATALVSACFAVLKQAFPKVSQEGILQAIKFTALPVNKQNLSLAGNLGAGIPDLEKAYTYLKQPEFRYANHNPLLSEGSISYSKKHPTNHWKIYPEGSYKNTYFRIEELTKKDLDKKIRFDFPDSSVVLNCKDLIQGIEIPSANIRIRLGEKKSGPSQFKLLYEAFSIDSTTLFCSGTQVLHDSSGIITDGSGNQNYSNNTSCFWQIVAPEGYRIEFDTEYINTEGNMDFLWIFDGSGTLTENIIAKFSGFNKAPVVTSRSNQALLWFLSNGKTTGAGWKVKYKVVR